MIKSTLIGRCGRVAEAPVRLWSVLLFLPSPGFICYVSLDDDVSVLVDLVVAHIRDLGSVSFSAV